MLTHDDLAPTGRIRLYLDCSRCWPAQLRTEGQRSTPLLAVTGTMRQIRSVPLSNISLPLTCAGLPDITGKFTDGNYHEGDPNSVTNPGRTVTLAHGPVYGDLTGDGLEEAALVARCTVGDSNY